MGGRQGSGKIINLLWLHLKPKQICTPIISSRNGNGDSRAPNWIPSLEHLSKWKTVPLLLEINILISLVYWFLLRFTDSADNFLYVCTACYLGSPRQYIPQELSQETAQGYSRRVPEYHLRDLECHSSRRLAMVWETIPSSYLMRLVFIGSWSLVLVFFLVKKKILRKQKPTIRLALYHPAISVWVCAPIWQQQGSTNHFKDKAQKKKKKKRGAAHVGLKAWSSAIIFFGDWILAHQTAGERWLNLLMSKEQEIFMSVVILGSIQVH